MRIVSISNRLPVKIVQKEKEIELHKSPGGIVSGLTSYLELQNTEYLWIGWPGGVVEEKRQKDVARLLLKNYQSFPIFLPQLAIDRFYNGFCNKVLWPLFHYFPSFVQFNQSYWEAYRQTNLLFVQKVAPLLREDDLIIVHDYHLMLLPQLLRKYNKNFAISFFLHIPFPAWDIFRMLPNAVSEELLSGLLGADLIGFHTHEYQQNFLLSLLRILGTENKLGNIYSAGRLAQVKTFPLGIDFQKFQTAANSQAIKHKAKQLKKTIGQKKVIFSVDRLDYTKGIHNRLIGYEFFLKQHPEYHGKVVLLVSSEPSRTDVEQYKKMKRVIDESIGRINGLFGSLFWQPIIYTYTSLSFDKIVALYTISDVALITPLRDGMNLVAKEYVASKIDRKGVLVLSEMAGAAGDLHEALLINPYDMEEIAQAIYEALSLPKNEQKKRLSLMQNRLQKHDVLHWADSLNKTLLLLKEKQKKMHTSLLSEGLKEKIAKHYSLASRRLIFLDYDGTLVDFSPMPYLAKPPSSIISLLKKLSDDYRSEVILISGRDRKTMQKWFPMQKLSLVAEHGIFKKERQEYYWTLMRKFSNDWKKELVLFFTDWVDRVPGSFVEEKEYALAWHYRLTDQKTASDAVKEILYELTGLTATVDLEVLHGEKVIEVKNMGADKGSAANFWISKKKYDFILAIGDDKTDEDLFAVLPKTAYSLKVGEEASLAKFRLKDSSAVREFLSFLIKHGKDIGESYINLPISYH